MGNWCSVFGVFGDIRVNKTVWRKARIEYPAGGRIGEGQATTVLHCACGIGGSVLSGGVRPCGTGTDLCARDSGLFRD